MKFATVLMGIMLIYGGIIYLIHKLLNTTIGTTDFYIYAASLLAWICLSIGTFIAVALEVL